MKYIKTERTDDNIVIAEINCVDSKVNKVSSRLLDETGELFDKIEKEGQVRGLIIISGKENNFIVGADIVELKSFKKPEEVEAYISKAHGIINRLADAKFPVVAAIHGECLGGGLELAMAASYRIASDSPETKLGLPEVMLGLLPAAGGTHRLPRLIGLRNALPAMLQGRSFRAHKAKKIGLVDELVSPHGMKNIAVEKIRQIAGKRLKNKGPKRSLADLLLLTPPGRKAALKKARQMVDQQTQGNYPAPYAILDSVEYGYKKGVKKGMLKDIDLFKKLVMEPGTSNFIFFFDSMNELKKNPLKNKVRKVEKLAVIGAGLMGHGIAAVSTDICDTIVIKDVSVEAAAKGLEEINKGLQKRFKSGGLTEFQRDSYYGKLIACDDYSYFKNTDLVIEAVFEDLKLKQQILKDVEDSTGSNTIFASNTSALPITDVAKKAKRPGNVIGMHYFSPVPKMPLLEIIKTARTHDWVTATALDFGIKQGKACIIVKDCPGFYTTRILTPLLNEFGRVLAEGVDPREIDMAMRRFGFPVGPAALIDEVGIDVASHVAEGSITSMFTSRKGFTRELISDTFRLLNEKGYKGRKNKKGLYDYNSKKHGGLRNVNPHLFKDLGIKKLRPCDEETVRDRLALVLINEAVLCLEEGIISCPRDGDIGAVFGMGFPPFTGGPFHYIDSVGARNVVDRIHRITEKFWGSGIQPSKLLLDKAKSNKKFY